MSCKRCQNTGWVQVETPKGVAAKRCRCHQSGLDKSKYSKLSLPPRFADLTFDNFSAGHYREERAKYNTLTAAMGAAKRFADEFPMGSKKGLLFHGGTVERNSHLGVATLKRLADKGLTCLYFDYQDLLRVLGDRRSEDTALAAKSRAIAASVRDADVLLIDSLGERRVTEWGLDTIGALIKHRYHNQSGLLVTTSLPLDAGTNEPFEAPQAVPSFGRVRDSLPDRIGWQSVERLSLLCDQVPVGVRENTPSPAVLYQARA